MTGQQPKVERTEVLSNGKKPPNRQPKLGSPLHRATAEERDHQDQGRVSDSPRWRENVRRERD